MDFTNQIKALAALVPSLRDRLKSEEATKLSLVQPFIKILGYDLSNPADIIPEFDAAIGVKQGEKIDYALCNDGCPAMLVECKHSGKDLDPKDEDQLRRYFQACTTVRIGILTNGMNYKFFTDTELPNVMDGQPFFEFDMLKLGDPAIQDLKQFTKEAFNPEVIPDVAIQLKYLGKIKERIRQEFANPTDEFIGFMAREIHDGKRVNQRVLGLFKNLTQTALKQYMGEQIDEVWNEAKRKKEGGEIITQPPEPEVTPGEPEFTAVENEGFFVIRTLIYPVVGPERIYYRKKKGKDYLNIILDDSQRKPICRLYLNGETKYMGLWEEVNPGEGRKENKVLVDGLIDLYGYAGRLKAIVDYHLKPNSVASVPGASEMSD